LFAAIRFFAAFGVTELGSSGVYLTSAVAGAVDADSVVFSMSGLMRENKLQEWPAAMGVIIAIAANFVLKSILAWSTARGVFGRRVTIGFVLMTAAAVAGMFVHF
jgi:uncharacterized membrane protein (DUF4010 family)